MSEEIKENKIDLKDKAISDDDLNQVSGGKARIARTGNKKTGLFSEEESDLDLSEKSNKPMRFGYSQGSVNPFTKIT